MKLTPQDIGKLQADVQVINLELTSQIYLGGYFATNDEILTLQSCAQGDYAQSAEDQLVWDYQDNWIEIELIVPDQITPVSNTISLADSGTGEGNYDEAYGKNQFCDDL
ncbi:MAG: hypothetical protein EZS28_015752 [Streblomastix strix]|uniref:Uncharacterized protein n=1 Tax=Streblomastix strix TaxID=222440 RepID=A0A5J4W2N7_9EUKA|nr:MAG: hypothetical protein EZS28_015752 [Streblomastix strix]